MGAPRYSTMSPGRFKELRERLGLTQDGLAQMMKIHRRTVIRYECGEVPVPFLVGRVLELTLRTKRRKAS